MPMRYQLSKVLFSSAAYILRASSTLNLGCLASHTEFSGQLCQSPRRVQVDTPDGTQPLEEEGCRGMG
jgi:hypothetical protein